MSDRHRTIASLLLILGFAVVLRWPGMSWGFCEVGRQIRFVPFHPDEPRFVEIARGLRGEREFRRSYVLGLGSLLRVYLEAADRMGHPAGNAELVFAARCVSLAAGLGMVVIAFLLGQRLTNSRDAGLLAAVLVAGNTWCVTQSHYGTADMTYTFLLYLFAWLAWRAAGRRSGAEGIAAAVVAGVAMAMKFGLVLLPSLLLLPMFLPRRRVLWAAILLGVSVLVFSAAQGFRFGLSGMAMVWAMFTQENMAGAGGPRLWNPVIYLLELLRILGLPALLLLPFARRGLGGFSKPALIAFLPIALHAVSILALRLPFPRHLLPVIPVLLIAAAAAATSLAQFRTVIVPVLAAWSMVLAISDQVPFSRDPRLCALEWLFQNVPQDQAVSTDKYFKIPLVLYYPSGTPRDADFVIRHEGWVHRFRRSEVNPAGMAPGRRLLYNAEPDDYSVFLDQERDIASGRRRVVFRQGPPVLLPEQWLYNRIYGSLEKFAGSCEILALAPAGTRLRQEASAWQAAPGPP
jgi:hypothetical protein